MFTWQVHDHVTPCRLLFQKTIPASYYIYTAWQRENELPIYKKWRVIIFFKEIWVQAVGLPKSFISYLNFLIPDQTQPPDEKSIFQSFFLFQLFWEVGINGNEICGNECTLLFRAEPLYSSLFLLYLMYPKLTKKLDNKILNPKKIGDWEQLTILDYYTFLHKKNKKIKKHIERLKKFSVIKC